jgi:hypothetical protein
MPEEPEEVPGEAETQPPQNEPSAESSKNSLPNHPATSFLSNLLKLFRMKNEPGAPGGSAAKATSAAIPGAVSPARCGSSARRDTTQGHLCAPGGEVDLNATQSATAFSNSCLRVVASQPQPIHGGAMPPSGRLITAHGRRLRRHLDGL